MPTMVFFMIQGWSQGGGDGGEAGRGELLLENQTDQLHGSIRLSGLLLPNYEFP